MRRLKLVDGRAPLPVSHKTMEPARGTDVLARPMPIDKKFGIMRAAASAGRLQSDGVSRPKVIEAKNWFLETSVAHVVRHNILQVIDQSAW